MCSGSLEAKLVAKDFDLKTSKDFPMVVHEIPGFPAVLENVLVL